MAKIKNNKSDSFEKTLFKAADKLRKNMDAAEYKHIVLGLIFLKYISDSFEELHNKLREGKGEFAGANPEDADEYRAENVFFVPQLSRWSHLHSRAMLPSIGKDVDDAMEAIEKDNQTLKGILPKVYARANLDKSSLGGLINLIGNIALGDEAAKSKDILGKVYEYFLGGFALAEGKKGGQFYTPKSVVQLLVNVMEPFKGRVYDPCCGSGGMFVMSEKFVKEHSGRLDDISIYGQESNQTTYRLCRMNLAIRGIDSSQVKWNNEGSFLKDMHPDIKADFILANPPFNDSDWSGELLQKDGRWKYGVPPTGNANFAWIQHFIYHLSPNGMAGFVMHCGAASNKGYEAEIRKNIIDNDLIDCIIYTPTQLFYNTSLPVHLWFLSRNKNKSATKRDRTNKVLMIDASRLGTMIDSTHRILSDTDLELIANTYHSWIKPNSLYKDVEGFCKSVNIDDIKNNNYVVAPNRYVNTKNIFNKYIVKAKDITHSIQSTFPIVELVKQKIDQINNSSFANKLDKYTAVNRAYIWEEIEVFQVIDDMTGGEWGYENPKDGYIECKIIRGTDFPNIPLYNLAKLPTRYIKKDKVDSKRVEGGDLIVEMSGGSKDQPTGRCVYISEYFLKTYDVPILYSNFCKRIRVNKDIIDPYWFYLYWMTAYDEGLTTKYENQPSGIKNFQLDEFIASELIILPPKEIEAELLETMKSLYEVEQLSNLTSYLLKGIEKQLFYKLLSENYDS
jgi:type I restriction enzyme M protein